MRIIKVSAIIFIILLSSIVSAGQQQQGYFEIPDKSDEVRLDGIWEFFPDRLIYPNEFERFNIDYINFPKVWSKSDGVATYRVFVELNPNKNWAIYLPPAYSSYSLFWNGVLISRNGIASEDRTIYKPQWVHNTIRLDKELLKNTNELVLHIANYSHAKGGPTNSIIIGNAEWMLKKRELIKSFDIFISGALVMGGLFFLGMFLYGRQQRNILYFSLLCITFSYYVIGSGNHSLHSLFPSYNWNLAINLEYLSLYLSAFFIAKFIEHSYPNEIIKSVINTYNIICFFFILEVILVPVKIFTLLNIYFLIITGLAVIYSFYVIIRAELNQSPGAKYSLLAFGLLILALTLRALNILGLTPHMIYVVPIGYVMFFFLHSLTLSQQFAITWAKAKENAESALKAKSEFLSVMSHEIRTPLNAVTGMVHHLLSERPREDQMETINALKFSSENLLSLINNILDFNKIDAGKIHFTYTSMNLVEIGEKIVSGMQLEAIRKGNEIQFIHNFSEHLVVEADKGKMLQILFNLVGNAVKFTSNGSIKLIMTELNRDKQKVTIKFEVKDSGIGISPDKLERIFETFGQADSQIHQEFGGTGLGLTICKKLLELQGVQILIDSEPGRGSSFYFTQQFNIVETTQKVEKSASAGKEKRLEGFRILLVEDNEMNVLVVTNFLKKWGLEFERAEDGVRALEKYSDDIDLILMDIQMPKMDGYEASKKLRERGCEVPIIALTATSSESLQEKITEAGMNDFVRKPYHPDELFEKLCNYLSALADR